MLRALHGLLFVLASATSLAGCFLDRSPLDSAQDASIGCGVCPPDQECVAGQCTPTGLDADGDGVPAAEDCDDTDPAVGRSTERDCEGDCGSGIERCSDGVWGACDAPTGADCDCTPGHGQTVRCSMCGQQAQRCGEDGRWANEGTCTGMGECVAEVVGTETMPCGLCGEGTQTRTRTCSDTCAWGDWSDWSECMGETAECPAGLEEVESRSCGSCGTQTRTRACSATCGWDAWSDWGVCTMPAETCTPGAVDEERENCPCGSGASTQRTRTRTCESTCAWGEWSAWTECASGECVAGTTETGAARFCGSCGSQRPTRTCTAECAWGPWVDGTCTDTQCTGAFGRRYCACSGGGGWTCCPTGDWSGWLGSCGGCP